MKKMQENELHLDDSSSSSFSDIEEKKENDNNKNEIINPLTSLGEVVTVFTYPYLSAGASALGYAKG